MWSSDIDIKFKKIIDLSTRNYWLQIQEVQKNQTNDK